MRSSKQTSLICIRDTNPGLFRTVTMNAVCCRWCVLFSHPSDFTPVCTTEVGRIAQEASEFFRRGVKLLGHSCDSLQKHRKWLEVSSTQMLVLIAMIFWYVDMRLGDRGSTVVKVLYYKSGGRWFDPRWCHWNFSLT